MRRLVGILLCPVILFSISTALVAQEHPAGVKPEATRSGSLKVGPIKELRKGVDAWPQIITPDNPPMQRVNATLTALNLRLAQALRNCDQNYLEWLKLMGDAVEGKTSTSGDRSRKVKVTMEGPRFLSLVATDEVVFCGGAHPDADRNAMVFDVTTGALVDWSTPVANSAGASPKVGSGLDGATASRLAFPALEKINVSRADAECKDAFGLPQSFVIWPDAKKGTLIVQEADLPHVVQACAKEIALTMNEARKLGFDESLLRAIELGHRQSVASPSH
jgi:hypothetical protein